MVFGDFNAHHSFWFSRRGDDRAAARGETLDGAIYSSQLLVAIQDLPRSYTNFCKADWKGERGRNSSWSGLQSPLQLEGNCTSLHRAAHCLFRPIRHSEGSWGTSTATTVWTPPYRPFDERGVAAAVRKAGSSTVLHLRRLGEHGLGFLAELINLSVAEVDTPAIWKNSVIIPILKAGKPQKLKSS